MDQFIRAAGVALRISDSGTGSQTVVLLHGYLESMEVWEDFAERLSRCYRVVRLDLPGHGISEVCGEVHTMEFMAEVVHGVFDALHIERAVLVGHSLGGYVAMAFAEAWPERLSGLVLFHSVPGADSVQRREARQREIDLVLAGKKDTLARITPGNGVAPENRVRMASKIEEQIDQVTLTDDAGIVAILRGMMDRSDRTAVLQHLSVPVLLFFGRHDSYIAPELAASTISALPSATVVWLEHSGHMGFVEEENASYEALTGWIDGLLKADGSSLQQ